MKKKNYFQLPDEKSKYGDKFNIISQVVQQTSEMIVVIDNNGIILDCNPRFEKLIDAQSHEITGKSFREFLVEPINQKFLEYVISTLQSANSLSIELPVRGKNKSIIYLELFSSPLLDEGGNISCYVCTAKDVTERKRTNELLHKQESILRMLFDNISDIVIVVAPDGRIDFISPCHVKCKEKHIKKDCLSTIYDITPKTDHAAIKGFIELIMKNPRNHDSIQFSIECRKKGNLLVEARGGAAYIENKDMVTLVCRDISKVSNELAQIDTYRKSLELELNTKLKEISAAEEKINIEQTWRQEAEEELRLKEERLELIVEISDYGLWDLNFINGKIYCNSNFIAILDLDKSYREKIDLDFYENMIHSDDLRLFKQTFLDHLDNSISHFDIEHRLISHKKKNKWVSVKGKVIQRDNKGNPIRFIGRIEDITQRKNEERKIKSAFDREKELHDIKSHFISKVSHEFRTPLATILSSIEILENYLPQLTDVERNKQFSNMHKCIDDLIEMLTDVITLNKPELIDPNTGVTQVELISFMQQIIEDICRAYPNSASIQFLPKHKVYNTRINEKLLKQVMRNLLTNAVKYTPFDKRIMVQLYIGDDIEIIVTDEGIGILVEDQKNIFEPFYRGKNVSGIPGSGLGLSILRQAVESLHGKLSFASTPGEGTTFLVSLPLTKRI